MKRLDTAVRTSLQFELDGSLMRCAESKSDPGVSWPCKDFDSPPLSRSICVEESAASVSAGRACAVCGPGFCSRL